ncbi:hypothetical protein FB451DRAFT_1227031 [Mycena latifolia]|nr:hypothetical protein FB451DRAFT_1227031 [Mycena latifolia]
MASVESLLSGLYTATHDLPMFHDGLPYHTHEHCSHCRQMQRAHADKLSFCRGCGVDKYCSKECQVAHWPTHKAQCKHYKAERLDIAKKSGIPNAIHDLNAWLKYYDTPLKNCAIAAMRLPENAHMERKEILFLHLQHKGDSTLPVHDRFHVMSISRRGRSDIVPGSTLYDIDAGYPEACARGKLEFGDNFYGSVRMGFSVVFNSRAVAERMKHFSIDKRTARAKIVRQDWWILLREYAESGAKVKFCCGRLGGPGTDDICCCGGWVHDAEKLEAFSRLGK